MTARIIAGRVAQQLAGAAVGLLTGLLTARWLGPEGKGLLAVVLLVSGVASQIATLGLHDAASFLRRRRGFAIATMLRVFDGYLLCAGVPAAILIGIVGHWYGARLWSQSLPLALAAVTAALALFRLGALLYKGLLQAEERFTTIAALDFCDAALPGIVWCALALIWGPSVLAASISFLSSAALTLTVARVRAARTPHETAKNSAAGAVAREMAEYGSKTYLRQIAMMAMARGDVFIVGNLLGVGAVGLYSVAVTLAEVIARFPEAVGWMLMPKSASLVDDAARTKSARYARLSMLVAAVVAIPYLAAANVLVRIALPPAFHGVVTLLAFLLPGVIASCISRVLGADLVGRGQAATVARITWITVAVILAADVMLIPAFGLAGAAIGSSIGQIVAAAIMAHAYAREAGLRIRALLVVNAEDVSMTLNGLVYSGPFGRLLGRGAR